MTAVLYSGLYLLFLSLFIFLALSSSGEEVPAYARDPPVFLPLRKMAVFLYRKLYEYRGKLRKKGRTIHIPGEEGVHSDLAVLYPSMKARRQEVIYRIRKTEKILMLLTGGILLSGILHFYSLTSGVLKEDGTIEREPAGGADKRISVLARPAAMDQDTGESKTGDTAACAARTYSMSDEKSPEKEEEKREEDYGTYTVTVHARQLTRQEAAELARTILDRFPDCLLGNNISADEIRYPLNMSQAGDTAPFTVDWESSRYSVLDTDGSIYNGEYGGDQAEQVDLTVFLSYADYRFEKKMAFTVRAPIRDEQARLRGEIENTLKAAERESAEESVFLLPSEADHMALSWEEQTEDLSPAILFMGFLICIIAGYIMDSRLHEQTLKRNRQLAIDYPQLISRIVLYLGAGMSVRNIFYKCAEEYSGLETSGKRKRRKEKGEFRYLHEEIRLVCNELESGVPETEAYMHFGRRCRSRQYTRLCSLLVQNLRRGNDTLLAVLQEEAQSSFEERKNLARELGEEAGTKLLFPMMIMLGVTMLIIIVPAYFSFSM